MCGKRGIGEFLKDQQELQLRCLLQQEKKWRCVDRPVDALGLTNESPLSCFPCVLCFSSFYLTSPCKTWTFYLLKWFGTWQRSCPVFQNKSNLNPLSKQKYTWKPNHMCLFIKQLRYQRQQIYITSTPRLFPASCFASAPNSDSSVLPIPLLLTAWHSYIVFDRKPEIWHTEFLKQLNLRTKRLAEIWRSEYISYLS